MDICPDPEGWGPISQSIYNFTPCFLDSAVKLVLAVGLLILVPRDVKALNRSQVVFSPFDVWFYVRIGFILLTALAELIYTAQIAVSLLDFRLWASITYLTSLGATLYVTYTEQFRARVTSGIVLYFWLFSVLLAATKVFGQVQRRVYDTYTNVFFLSVFILVFNIAEFLLSSLLPKPSSQYELLTSELDDSPEAHANIFSRITFSYMTKLMKVGYENYLTEDDLPNLPASSRTDVTQQVFDVAWQSEKTKPKPSLTLALVKSFGSSYLIAILFKLSGDVLAFTQPRLLRNLIVFVNSYNTENQQPISAGVIVAIGMFSCSFLQTVFQQQYMQRAFGTAMTIKSSLTSTLYRKAMVLSIDGRAQKSTADIVNLMAVDVQRLQEITQSGQGLWSGPFQIILCLYNLHALVGNSMWAGVLVTLLTMILNAHIARRQRALQKVQMKVKDKRTRLTGEILVSIKSIKLYAWEESFIRKLNEIRNNQELANLRTKGVLSAVSNFVGSCAPFFVSCSTFAFFVWTSNKPLSTDLVFPALTLFNLLSNPLTGIPQVITQFIEATVSANRLREFLITSEIQDDAVKRLDAASEKNEQVVSVSKGTFFWDQAGRLPPALKNIKFTVNNTQLACIVGRVGSGKSSLLQAILGDLFKASGSVTVRGHIAYCSQVPWIMNATVKDNILFGKKFQADFYEKTIKACALLEDFVALPDGDETIVGEKGISLSGGQKARLSLARAVYARADVYVLDDPLSAVDQHVGRHIIDNVLGPKGLLSSKTKIMATNAIPVLSVADSITMLRGGEIVETGLYTDIINKSQSEIYKLIKEYGSEQHNEEEAVVDIQGQSFSENKTTHPLATGDGEDEEEEEEEILESNFGISLRRASTASFKKPALIDDMPTRRSRQVKEHSEKGQVKMSVYKEYIKAANIYVVVLFIILMFCSNSMSVGGNVWLKHWSEVNTEYGGNPDTAKYLGTYLFFGVAAALLSLIYTLVLWIFCTIEAARKLHDMMLRRVIRAPMSFFDTTPIGRIINRFTADVNRVDENLARVFTNFFTNTFKVLFAIIVISSANPIIILFAIPMTVLYVYFQKFYLRTSRELKRLESVSRSPIYAHFQESLNGVSTVRAYSQIRRFNKTNEYHIDFNNKAYYPSMIARRWLAVRLEVIGSFIIFLTALLSVIAISIGSLSSGLVGLTMSYAFQITSSLSAIVRLTVEVEISTVSVERILEYCKIPTEAKEIIESNRPSLDWPTEGAVEFHDYSTRYRAGLDLVLKGINLRIKPKEKIGIVGRTGAGKSSLTLALFRLIEPVGGYIAIDKLNTSRIGLKDLRQGLSIIPQDSQAFEGTVRDNLDPGSKYTDDEIWHALELSHLKAHIKSMDGGLYSLVQDGGSNFSVGQRQLLSLARALLTPSRILVLDEATAAVDVETDQIIQQTIRNEFKDRTILTIAHRLNTIIDSDKIVVLAAGRIVEFDTPDNLLQNSSSLFYSLCKQGGLVE
ncbi:P-loop containing nucleoside triphosphate hydrolase protein [Lipomyces japonicus]|uniref:P-loop containing nucleoside triphosphate hydrolase protein n=1 Tax=Lipomyces japonicus TaxID=56871 RepID=UPI0034CD4BCD